MWIFYIFSNYKTSFSFCNDSNMGIPLPSEEIFGFTSHKFPFFGCGF